MSDTPPPLNDEIDLASTNEINLNASPEPTRVEEEKPNKQQVLSDDLFFSAVADPSEV